MNTAANAVSDDSLQRIADSAMLAPSADNRHRAVFERASDGLRIRSEVGFLSSAPPHRRALTLIGYGAMAENMRLTAATLGVDCRCRWLPDPADPDLVVTVQLGCLDRTEPDDLAAAIPRRHTNRKFYDPRRKVDPTALQALEREAGTIAGVRLDWLDGKAARRTALRLIRRAEAERFRRRVLHEELFSSIRFDIGWQQTTEEGLPPGALEVEAPLRAAFGALRHWRLMRALQFIGAHYMLGLRAGDLPCRLAPHLGVISTELGLDEAAIAVGRALQRVWLRATVLGIALQPMAASVVLPLQTSEDEGLSDAARSELRAGWSALCPGRKPLMLFRTGYASAPRVRAARPTVAIRAATGPAEAGPRTAPGPVPGGAGRHGVA